MIKSLDEAILKSSKAEMLIQVFIMNKYEKINKITVFDVRRPIPH